MGVDEEGTLARLKSIRKSLVDPAIASHRGRIVKTTGDGMLVEFASAVDAVTCAVAVQEKMAEQTAAGPRIQFRIGINIGDIIVDDEDIFGDGVNVAARVENECEPGGVCLSGSAFEQVRGKTGITFDELGERLLKNIDRPVRLYSARLGEGSAATIANLPSESLGLSLPDGPSIAVLPFQNMSGDPEQEYFADGMVEEIITALSRFRSLFVIARNSSFTFKGRAVDIKEVGRRLGVRHVLEGSVRKAAGKVRITGQLIDAVTGAHIWADRFERDLSDIFALQDEVAVAVVSAILPKLFLEGMAMATRRRPENLTAYDLYLRALQQYYKATAETLAEAIKLMRRAVELDPGFGLAAAVAGAAYMNNVIWGYAADPEFDRKEAIRFLRLALSVDDSDSEKLAIAAVTSAYMLGDSETEIEIVDRAVALNPNSYQAWNCRGWVYKIAGLPEEAIRSFERIIPMSPVDPTLFMAFGGMGLAFLELRRFDEAVAAGKKALRLNPSYAATYRCLASAYAHLGRDAEARDATARLLELDPTFTISAYIARGGQSNSKLLIDGLRKAGLE